VGNQKEVLGAKGWALRDECPPATGASQHHSHNLS